MPDIANAAALAIQLIRAGDPVLWQIIVLSLTVSLSAVLFATVLGLPIGAALALGQFPGRNGLVVMFNASMGLPPVVVGLAVYLLLSRSGPLGELGFLFTPQAMMIAQAILVFPIVVALSRQVIEDLWAEYSEQLRSLGSSRAKSVGTLLWDGRFSLVTVILAGFGRAAAEVGAIMIVGGNIDGFTRTMTTAIALETSKGDLALALALGFVLLALVIIINAGAWGVRRFGERLAGA
jgi:tungstate transport system permease protein